MRDADDELDDEPDEDELEDDDLDDELDDDLDDEIEDDLDVEIDDLDDADSEELDEEFPIGEGSADDSALVSCPYCGEGVETTLDPAGGAYQQYIEDCHVCCQPWRVEVRYDPSGSADVQATALDE
jgi:hypothetical protein